MVHRDKARARGIQMCKALRRSRTMRITSPIASLGVMMRALMIGSEIDSYALGSGIWSGLSRSFTVPSFIFTL